MQESLTLFDIPVTTSEISKGKPKIVKQSNIGWSFSKMEMFHTCPRKYYYHYFGGSKRKAKNDTQKEDIAMYKDMANIHIIVGDIVHETIAIFLDKLRKEDEKDFDFLIWLSNQKLDAIVEKSVNLKNGTYKEGEYKAKICKEIFEDTSKKDEIVAFAKEKIHQSFDNFYNSEDFEIVKDNACYEETIIEGKAKLKLGNINIDGRIDFAFEDNGKFHILDWKTSHYEYEETSVQLLVYALWAIEKHNQNIEDICIHKAFLLDGKMENLEFNEKHLERAKVKIRQSVDEMNEFEKYGNEGIIEAFDCCDELKICNLCQYEKICKSSKNN